MSIIALKLDFFLLNTSKNIEWWSLQKKKWEFLIDILSTIRLEYVIDAKQFAFYLSINESSIHIRN